MNNKKKSYLIPKTACQSLESGYTIMSGTMGFGANNSSVQDSDFGAPIRYSDIVK